MEIETRRDLRKASESSREHRLLFWLSSHRCSSSFRGSKYDPKHSGDGALVATSGIALQAACRFDLGQLLAMLTVKANTRKRGPVS